MTWWQRLREDHLIARQAQPTDRPALADLQVRAWRRHGMLAIEDQVALLNSGLSTLAFGRDKAVGFLGLHLREPTGDEQWVDASMVTLASSVAAGRTLGTLLQAALPALRARHTTAVVCLTVDSWLHSALIECGFTEIDQVISYVRASGSRTITAWPVAKLRPAGPADADVILALNAAAFSGLWRYDSATTLSWLFTAEHAVLAEIDGRPAAFALTSRAPGNGYDQLIRLATHPAAQGQGIGRQLVTDAIAYSDESGSPGLALNTQFSNAVSRHLYEALGFRVVGAPVHVMIYKLRG
jgi:GNAT superfamily N-acetyltransferase